MSNPPSSGSIITVVPRALIRNPAMPSHRSTVPSCRAKASAPNGRVCGARACCFISSVPSVGWGLELVLGHRHRGHGFGPAGVEGEVGDGLDELFLGDAVLLGEGQVEVQLLDIAAGDEGSDGGQAPVALGEPGAFPDLVEEDLVGVVDEPGREISERAPAAGPSGGVVWHAGCSLPV